MEILFILPWIVNQTPNYSETKWFLHVFVGTFIYLNCLACFWKIISTETSTKGIVLPSLLKPGWRYCPVCEANSPPRSFHCYVCRCCILRRDHHCVFTGNCIGLKNHRYYIMLVTYCLVASLYANYMNIDYMRSIHDGFSFTAILKLIFPLFSFVLMQISWATMWISIVLLLCVAVTFLLSALLFYHVRNMVNGQVTFEKTHKIHEFNRGLLRNIKEVFGKNWTLAWLSPWIPSDLPGNGLEFPVSSLYENPKDM